MKYISILRRCYFNISFFIERNFLFRNRAKIILVNPAISAYCPLPVLSEFTDMTIKKVPQRRNDMINIRYIAVCNCKSICGTSLGERGVVIFLKKESTLSLYIFVGCCGHKINVNTQTIVEIIVAISHGNTSSGNAFSAIPTNEPKSIVANALLESGFFNNRPNISGIPTGMARMPVNSLLASNTPVYASTTSRFT